MTQCTDRLTSNGSFDRHCWLGVSNGNWLTLSTPKHFNNKTFDPMMTTWEKLVT